MLDDCVCLALLVEYVGIYPNFCVKSSNQEKKDFSMISQRAMNRNYLMCRPENFLFILEKKFLTITANLHDNSI